MNLTIDLEELNNATWDLGYLVVSFPPCGPPLLGSLLAWTLVIAPCSK
jgi:hypothetical protein